MRLNMADFLSVWFTGIWKCRHKSRWF